MSKGTDMKMKTHLICGALTAADSRLFSCNSEFAHLPHRDIEAVSRYSIELSPIVLLYHRRSDQAVPQARKRLRPARGVVL
jgi:hypothetical protein